jgi:hypothetical protein
VNEQQRKEKDELVLHLPENLSCLGEVPLWVQPCMSDRYGVRGHRGKPERRGSLGSLSLKGTLGSHSSGALLLSSKNVQCQQFPVTFLHAGALLALWDFSSVLLPLSVFLPENGATMG